MRVVLAFTASTLLLSGRRPLPRVLAFDLKAEEERKIRRDPAARVTGLLKEVFGR
jgi:hypothetical protein